MSSLFKNKAAVVAGISTAVVLIIVGVSHVIGFNPVNSAVRTILSPFQSGISYIANKTSGVVNYLWEMKSYKDENIKLTDEMVNLQAANRDVAQYREENERLKELLQLQQSLSNYSTVAASVIGYSENNWYDKVEIGKGELNGVSVGNTVIAREGVVGIVTEVGPNWAMVTTILKSGSATGVKITRTGDIAVLEGDEEMCKNGQCKMTFVNSSANIIVGDLVETSGSSGIYPADLRIGTVTDINADNMGQINYTTITPSVDLSTLHEVLVINGVS